MWGWAFASLDSLPNAGTGLPHTTTDAFLLI